MMRETLFLPQIFYENEDIVAGMDVRIVRIPKKKEKKVTRQAELEKKCKEDTIYLLG
jgi:ribosomal protein L5